MHLINHKNSRLLIFSDTHGKHGLLDIPGKIDIIIHCGDICTDGDENQIIDFFKWFSALRIKHKIFVHGNHDYPFQFEPEEAEEMVPFSVRWIRDQSITINDISISALSDCFHFLDLNISLKTDILISHAPPAGILDNGIGSVPLRDFVFIIKPIYHVFGHNHAGYGQVISKNIHFINAAEYDNLSRKTSPGTL